MSAGACRDTPFDRTRLAAFTGGDSSLERELIHLFLETAALHLDRLRRAIDDPAAWRASAHALKGASANVGAVAVAKLAAQQEHVAPSLAGLEDLLAEVAAVREAYDGQSPS